MKAKRQFCFNCGADLGVYERYASDPPEACSKMECQRELNRAMRESNRPSERDEVDDYYRNRGGYY